MMDKPNAGPAAPLRKAVAGTTVHQKGVREVAASPAPVVPLEYILDETSDWNAKHVMGKHKGATYLAERPDGKIVWAVAQGPERSDPWTIHTTPSNIEPATEQGFWNYSDLITQTTPINIGALGDTIQLANDGLGLFTSEVFKPASMGSIWNPITSAYDLTGFNPRDVITFRADIAVTTVTNNTRLELNLVLGSGAGQYRMNFADRMEKKTGVHRINVTNTIFAAKDLLDRNTLDNPAYWEFISDAACTIQVQGLFTSVNHWL